LGVIRGSGFFRDFFVCLSRFDSLSGFGESITFAVGFQDVNPMGQAVEQGSGEPFASADFRPVLKGKIGRHDQAEPFISTDDDFKEEFRSQFGKRDIPQFIQEQQVVPLQEG
jgi:hypothetical protein